ncbi:hypothetical protein FRC09_003389 [Ceratobasidium sp. 395]|nr:hypothetical protein FRC09_003389 [Ceratobasidium sp. 395]
MVDVRLDHMNWDGLRALTEALGHNIEGFERLATTIGQLSESIRFFDDRARSRGEYSKIRIDMDDLLRMLSEYVRGVTTHTKLQSKINDLARAIETEIELLAELEGEIWAELNEIAVKGRMDRVLKQYRAIQVLLGKFVLDETPTIWKTAHEEALNAFLDRLPHSPSAWYRPPSGDSVRRSGCEPNTRVEVLDDIQYWTRYNVSQRLYWLNGLAGTGKSTIAYSVCEYLENSERPMASFFCTRRLPECRNLKFIIPDISYQLCSLGGRFRSTISYVMNQDVEVYNWPISEQFERLVATPLRRAGHTFSSNPVIVIDGLEECDDRDGVDEILRVLTINVPELPIKVLVTGRPTLKMDFFAPDLQTSRNIAELRLHELLLPSVQRDIEAYLRSRLEPISPPAEVLEGLASQSGGLFKQAAFYVRYLLGADPLKGIETIQQLLGSSSGCYSDRQTDFLYSVVLEAAFDENISEVPDSADAMLVLHTIVSASEALTENMLVGLPGLSSTSSIGAILENLGLVLQMVGTGGKVAVRYRSFFKYICDRSLSGRFYCNPEEHAERLVQACFGLIKSRKPAFNICNLSSSYIRNRDVPNIEEKVKYAIPDQLLHACRNWGTYITLIDGLDRQLEMLHELLSKRLLLWMEVLSLKHCMHDGAEQLLNIKLWLKKNQCLDTILPLLEDAQSFVAAFMLSPLSEYTPHIYVSALPFWPNHRPISQHYLPQTEGLVKLRDTSEQPPEPRGAYFTGFSVRSAAYSPSGGYIAISVDDGIWILDTHTQHFVGHSLTGHTNSVWSVVYSPNGAYIVSGSDDYTIRIWNAQTGQPVGRPLEGHTDSVCSVTCSPDGAYIASGSWDHTIRIWDAHTGQPVGKPLDGHTSQVYSVAYSPNGAFIASGSWDRTIRFWDACTGEPIGEPLKGHISSVRSVSYSPDGTRIASGSGDNTVRIWDSHTGQAIGEPLEGHTSSVNSVVYSPDGACIASGSDDYTIRIWDAHTGQPVSRPLESHADPVRSVAYSPDGAYIVPGSMDDTIRIWDTHTRRPIGEQPDGHASQVYAVAYSPNDPYIASGSEDYTIRIWDMHTGRLIGKPLEGHMSQVYSVAYSPDGAFIASGSEDNTIRIWEAHTGEPIGKPLEGHTDLVNSVTYSPDGYYIASGSDDYTIRIWDARTGQQVDKSLEGHTSYVNSVIYSPNGAYIASGSSDHTIRIWDAHTGQPVGRLLEGHTSSVYSVAYSPDGSYIASGSRDHTIRIWDAHTRQPAGKSLDGHTGYVNSVAYSPDGTYIASGSQDHTIRIWDAHTGRPLGKTLEGHESPVYSVTCSPDGAYIASGSSDRTIRTWTGLAFRPTSPQFHNLKSPKIPASNAANSQATPNRLAGDQASLRGTVPVEDWTMHEDGWIVDPSGHRLVWVPCGIRAYLAPPRTRLIISSRGGASLDFSHAWFGEDWQRCFGKIRALDSLGPSDAEKEWIYT